jgi:DNA-binding MarR family transcriptional regulator
VPDEAGRLSPPSVVLELHTADRLVRTLVTEAFVREGLHPSLFAILSLIEIHEPVTPTRLGAESGVRPTTLRDMVNEMVAAGHVRRVENEDDRRSHYLVTTAAARTFLRRAAPVVARIERELERELGAPLESLREPLRGLRHAARQLWLQDVESQLTRIRGL